MLFILALDPYKLSVELVFLMVTVSMNTKRKENSLCPSPNSTRLTNIPNILKTLDGILNIVWMSELHGDDKIG